MRTRLSSATIAVLLLSTLAIPAPAAAHTPPGQAVIRIAGDDRIESAIEVSHASFGDGTAGAAVLARSDDFADALAGTPLAIARGGPLLLTSSSTLDGAVLAELRRVLPSGRTVYLLGGTGALGPGVEEGVAAAGYTPVRLAGRTRYETSVRIAETLQPERILLATGRDFADAVSAGAAAGSGGVVLLTDGRTLPQPVHDYLRRHGSTPQFALGGPAAAAAPGAEPVVGVDRYDTAVRMAKRFFRGAAVVALASGERFPDALAGGAHVGGRGGPLLLTRAGDLPAVVHEHLVAERAAIARAFVYGGTGAVSDGVLDEAHAAIADGSASLVLLVPNGGEILGAGTEQVVEWAYEGDPAPLTIELIDPTGAATTVATQVDATTETFVWEVPQVSGEEYKLRLVVDSPTGGTSVIVDLSDATFAIHDVSGPEVKHLEFTPSTVDTSGGPATITFRARLTDNLSGVYDGDSACCVMNWARFESPSGQWLDVRFPVAGRISGTDLDGVYEATATLPQHAEQGVWRLVRFLTHDRAGNLPSMQEHELRAAGIPTTFEQTGPGDSAPPVLAALELSPTTVDTSGGPATIQLRARVTDDASGLSAHGNYSGPNAVKLVGPTGQYAWANLPNEPTSGTRTDGIYEFSTFLPRYSEPGTWRIEWVHLVDVAGNAVKLQGTELAARGLPTTIEQTGAGDTAPPSLMEFDILPRTVATSTGEARIVFRARITDDLAGVGEPSHQQSSGLRFLSPSSAQWVDAFFAGHNRATGTPTDGVYEFVATLPQFSEQGTWWMMDFVVRDDVGNEVFLDPAQLAGSGYPTTFEVRG